MAAIQPRFSSQRAVDKTVANAHQTGYGANATPAVRLTGSVRRVKSALLTVRMAATTGAVRSRCERKNTQLQPAFTRRLVVRARV